MQLQDQNRSSRILHVAKAALLPIVLSVRTMVEMAKSGRLVMRLPVLFWLILMQSAWALGEAIGALAGTGKSLDEWR
jgi:type III secretory pathway component EscU